MTRSAALLFVLLVGCAEPAPEPRDGQAGNAAAAGTTVVAPAGASEDQGILGAVPGECGSTRAAAYLGRTYAESMAEPMRASSGASTVRVYRPGDPPLQGGDGRTLNAYLDGSGRIVLLDCS